MKNLLLLILIATGADAQQVIPVSMTTDAIINLPIISTWNLFTTERGLIEIGYLKVVIDLKLNKRLHAEIKEGTATDAIDGTITSFDPEHMMSWQWSNQRCWSVLYFNAMGSDMTQIKWVDVCDSSTSLDLTKSAASHRVLFDQLIRRYAPECHVCKEERETAENHQPK